MQGYLLASITQGMSVPFVKRGGTKRGKYFECGRVKVRF